MLCFVSTGGFWTIEANAQAGCCVNDFAFSSLPKRRRFSEARQAKAQLMDVMEELLENTSADSEFIEPVHEVTTRDVGTQYGKLSKST